MSQIDDIIQSFVDERLADKKIIKDDSESEEGFNLFEEEESDQEVVETNFFENSENSKEDEDINEISSQDENDLDENKDINQNGNKDYQTLLKLNKIQSERIEKLEQDRHQITNLHREIDNLKSEITFIKGRNNNSEASYSSDDQIEESPSRNREFDFIPMIVRKKKKIKPMFCGRSISNYKRFTKDLCQHDGCIRCHLDKLIDNGYSIEKLREVREAFVHLN